MSITINIDGKSIIDFLNKWIDIQRNEQNNTRYLVITVCKDVEKIAKEHYKVIKEISDLINDKNIVDAVDKFYALANNEDFPNAYAKAKGILGEVKGNPPYHRLSGKRSRYIEIIDKVVDELTYFQYYIYNLDKPMTPPLPSGVLCVHLESFKNFYLSNVSDIHRETKSEVEAFNVEIKKLYTKHGKHFDGLSDVTKKDDLLLYVKTWINEWVDYVNFKLNGEGKLIKNIGALIGLMNLSTNNHK